MKTIMDPTSPPESVSASFYPTGSKRPRIRAVHLVISIAAGLLAFLACWFVFTAPQIQETSSKALDELSTDPGAAVLNPDKFAAKQDSEVAAIRVRGLVISFGAFAITAVGCGALFMFVGRRGAAHPKI